MAPGVYDGISARLALEAGFAALYMSGASSTASMLGQPDLALATQNDFVQVRTTFLNIPTHRSGANLRLIECDNDRGVVQWDGDPPNL